ncbi:MULTISPECIES: DnaJ domain-containing protein [unclassified Rhizobium]|uniref:DnaJ domain-containing protein n=1 Tax=unclassified Rhizobium TaxID=2613769 RepID=UPI000DC3C5AA|nr:MULTISPECIES: DnaJ domain-containing protein [unclassified Rhizobium]MBB3383014.1 DnaJ-class molecular chaperone [Rhizobium sp. BK098]MBB3614715.1 DnaJ-class molecular chaperone [Rhizobium sp. BK609]MBB3679898.1 DnaJ-class molecular chaperone [Rhizobium sp. BK612]
MRDPYKVLGVRKDAGADEIKSAWRNLAKTAHPDHNPGDPTASERFAEIGRAYETLKDPQKRSRYDQIARMAEAKGQSQEQTIIQQRQAAREAAERAKAARANADKIMEELARANARKAAASAASGQHGNAAESPEDMVERIFGVKTGQAQQAQATADVGAQQAEKPREQPTTAASEELQMEEEQYAAVSASAGSRSAFGILGSLVRRITGGNVPEKPPEKTPEVAAEATVTLDDMLKSRWIIVPLPDGREARFQATTDISNGQVLHLKGQGLKLQGMLRGDVAVTVHLSTDGRFTLEGSDVRTILPVSIENAVLGCETTVEGLNGPVRITVPAWSGSDQIIRISGEGLPNGNGAKGDLIVELRLMLWEKPDDKVTDLMRSMREGFFL